MLMYTFSTNAPRKLEQYVFEEFKHHKICNEIYPKEHIASYIEFFERHKSCSVEKIEQLRAKKHPHQILSDMSLWEEKKRKEKTTQGVMTHPA